jgi:hypothetical protein
MPTDIFVDGIKTVQMVNQGFKLEKFIIERDGYIFPLYFQHNEKQFFWNGLPLLHNPYGYQLQPYNIEDIINKAERGRLTFTISGESIDVVKKLNPVTEIVEVPCHDDDLPF